MPRASTELWPRSHLLLIAESPDERCDEQDDPDHCADCAEILIILTAAHHEDQYRHDHHESKSHHRQRIVFLHAYAPLSVNDADAAVISHSSSTDIQKARHQTLSAADPRRG